MEGCLEYSLQVPITADCVQAVWTQMKLYNVNVHGNKSHKHGAPQVHAWAALLHSVCKIAPQPEDEVCIKQLRDHYVAVAND